MKNSALGGRVAKVLTSTSDIRQLLRALAHTLSDTFDVEHVAFAVRTDTKLKHLIVGTTGAPRLPAADFMYLSDKYPGVVSRHSVKDKDVQRLLVSHHVSLAVPIHTTDQHIGYIVFGQRTARFSKRDIKELQAAADQIAIAIHNALAVQQIKELNENLEQRIDVATKELRASNAQLQRLDEAKDEFISMASHQLRTPLTSIKGYLSMMIEGDLGKVSDEQKHVLEEAFISSERMVRLIGDFLNVSRLQTGKFVIEKHDIDMAQLVQNEVDALSASAAGRDLSFLYRRPIDIPLVAIDENKIQQVVMNFCDNALFYSRPGSVITVSLKKVGQTLELVVKDTGIGVPEDQKDRLFTKFFRASNAKQQRPDGTGVGLFLAKKVIDAHGGEIIFESKEKKGSAFGFRLPLTK